MTADRRVILVGEANPYGGDPSFALYPLPAHASGGRLARILGLSNTQYLRAFRRRNLCPTAWSLATAKRTAGELLEDGAPLVLLGAKVCQAFARDFQPFTVRESLLHGERRRFAATLPHPSGLSRAWNAPDAVASARRTLEQLTERAIETGWSPGEAAQEDEDDGGEAVEEG